MTQPHRSRFVEHFDLTTAEYPPEQIHDDRAPPPPRSLSLLCPKAINTAFAPCTVIKRLARSAWLNTVGKFCESGHPNDGYTKLSQGSHSSPTVETCGGAKTQVRPVPHRFGPKTEHFLVWDRNLHRGNGRNADYFDPRCNMFDNSKPTPEQSKKLVLPGAATQPPPLADSTIYIPGVAVVAGPEETFSDLLWLSDEQACLARFADLWEDPWAKPVDQSLFAEFDWSHEELAQSGRSFASIENADWQEVLAPEMAFHEEAFRKRKSVEVGELFAQYARAVYYPYRYCDRVGLFPQP